MISSNGRLMTNNLHALWAEANFPPTIRESEVLGNKGETARVILRAPCRFLFSYIIFQGLDEPENG